LKTRIIVSLLLVFVFVVAGCTPAAPADAGPIKIAILAPLSGQNPTFGASTRDGALLAVEEWNAKGGVMLKEFNQKVSVEVLIEDC